MAFPESATLSGGRTARAPTSAAVRPRWIRYLPVVLPLAILLITGFRGLDFGVHWDERHYQIAPVKTMLSTGILLPGYYGYPSFNYWVGLAALLPEIPGALAHQDRMQFLAGLTDDHQYLVKLRVIFLIASSFSVLWVYLLVLKWRRSVLESFLASSFLALSWEVAYHVRWVATDGMLMQFAALSVFLCVMSCMMRGHPALLWLAAVSAGLGFGTKYPGGLLIVPVLITAACAGGQRERLYRLFVAGMIFAAAFLVSTPGALLAPDQFWHGVQYEIRHYSSGHAGHTVSPGFEHAGRILIYFSSVLFSRFTAVAYAQFALCVIGLYAIVSRIDLKGIVFLSFPTLYVAYFITQRAMLVRNLLAVAPFLAVLAAHGAGCLWAWGLSLNSVRHQRTISVGVRVVLATGLIAVLAINAAWLTYAANTIADRQTSRFGREAAAYLRARQGLRFWVSPLVRANLTAVGWTPGLNVVGDLSSTDYLVLYASEGMPRWQQWPANRPWLTERWFGAQEVNFNSYPNWWGDDRILVMSLRSARKSGVLETILGGHKSLTTPEHEIREPLQNRFAALPPDPSSNLPNLNPCTLLTRNDIELEAGPVESGPQPATSADGTACEYTASSAVVVIGLPTRATYECTRADAGGVTSVPLGDGAFWHPNGAKDISLFVRVANGVFSVRVAVRDDRGPVRIATALAGVLLRRLRIPSE